MQPRHRVSRAGLARALLSVVVALWIGGPALGARAADSAQSLTAGQKGWALATSAILFQRNSDSHDLLAGGPRTDAKADRARELLSDWWGIRSRADLLATLQWIQRGGHRANFATLGATVDRLNPTLVSWVGPWVLPSQLGHQVAVVQRHYKPLVDKGILAWDYSRYVALCRWGYASGFLTEDETWRSIMPAARLLQRHFTSWSDLGQNYLIGREFWSLSETQKSGDLYRATYQTLINYSGSPWNKHPWELELTD
jgi:Protein of unknown function (DUF1266)